ncbi:MAG: hypothetical protein J6U54_07950 [Clostridiales bacterium]|nr:hypothetical protein [Clostridiales bacterium]
MNEFLKKAFDLYGPLTFDEAWDVTKHEERAFDKATIAIFCLCGTILRLGYLTIKAIIEWLLEMISAVKVVIMAFRSETEEES